MTPTECVRLCKIVRAVAPAQKFEPETPDAWFPILAPFPLDEMLAAVAVVGQERPFIAPADLVQQVRKARREAAAVRRAEIEADPSLLPDADPDDPAAYLEALRGGRMRPVQSTQVDRRPEVRALLANAFPSPASL